MRASFRVAATAAAIFTVSCGKDQLQRVDSAPLITPTQLDFGLISLHGQASADLRLSNGGRAPLEVNAVVVVPSENGELSDGIAPLPFAVQPAKHVPLELQTDESTTLHVTFVPKSVGRVMGYVSVQSSSFELPDLRVPMRADVVDAEASIEPSQLDFGKIEVGTTALQALTVRNDSPLDVTVTPTAQGTGAGVFTAHALTIPARESRQLPVTFAPTAVGQVVAGLAVTKCTGCAAQLVNLFGEGLDSAIVVDPSPLAFHSVPIDASASVSCRIINVSSLPVELKGAQLDPASDPGYVLLQKIPDTVLTPGAWLATSVRFTPTHLGAARGALQVFSSSHRHPTLSTLLAGNGGGAEIATSPDQLDLGTAPVEGEVTGTIHVANAGSDGDVLTVGSVTLEGPAAFQLDAVPLPMQLTAGQSVDLTIRFDPSQPGSAHASLRIDSSDGSAPHVEVPIVANGRATAPCQFDLEPTRIDFGNVPPGSGAVLGIRFTNRGDDLCVVKSVAVTDAAQGAFFMPGGALPNLTFWPGDSVQTQVAFKPIAGGVTRGTLTLQVNDPARPNVQLPLVGDSQNACLTAAPPFLDFGALRSDCSHPGETTHVVNACTQPVTIARTWIGAGTSDEFTIASVTPAPLTLQPGEGTNVTVDYAAQERGQDFSPLFISESDVATAPLLVPLLGEGLEDGNTIDHFVQADATKADVLFIVDNSESMVEEQPRLESAIPAFVQAARAQGMDLHVAVTTTGIDPVDLPGCNGGANGGEAGRLFPVDNSAPRIIDLTQSTPEQELTQNVNVGLCHHLEQGLEATRRALSSPLVDDADDPLTAAPNDGNAGFLRSDAQLSVVVVSDEDDHSADPVADYASFLRSVKGLSQPQRASFFAIAPLSSCASSSGSSAARYGAMAQATGGEIWDVCDSDYGPALQEIAARSFGPQARFPLTQPADPSTVTVSVNGQPAAPGSWSYDPSTNAIVFASAPAPGTTIDVAYKIICP